MDASWLDTAPVDADFVGSRVAGIGISGDAIEYTRAILAMAGKNPFVYREVLDVNPPSPDMAMAMWSLGATVASVHKSDRACSAYRAMANEMCGDLPFSFPVGVHFATYDVEGLFPFAPAYNARWGMVTCFDVQSLNSPSQVIWDIHDMADSAIFLVRDGQALGEGAFRPRGRRGWRMRFADVPGGRLYYLYRRSRGGIEDAVGG